MAFFAMLLPVLWLAGSAGAQTAVYDSSAATDFTATRVAVSAGSVLVNGLTDVQGGVYSTGGGLIGTPEGTVGSAYLRDFLVRPSGENSLTSQVVLDLPASGSNTGASVGGVVRFQPATKSYYMASVTYASPGASLTIYSVVSGTVTAKSSVSFSYNNAHSYEIGIIASGTNPTTLSATVLDTISGTSLTCSASDSTAALQVAGAAGAVVWAAPVTISRLLTFNSATPYATSSSAATSYNVSQLTSGGANGSPVTLTVTPTPGGSVAGSNTVTPSVSGVAGVFNPTSVTMSAAQQTLTFTPSSTGNAVLSFTNSGGFPNPPNLSYFVGPPVSVGFIGDSNDQYIPADGSQSAPQSTIAVLSALYSPRPVIISNPVAGAGTRTSDWLSGSANLIAAKSAFATAGVRYVMVDLGGTNDSNGNIAASVYRSNLSSTLSDLTSAGYICVVNYAPYVAPGAVPFNNSSVTWTSAQVALVASYEAQQDSLVNGTTVLAGDKTAFAYFRANQSQLRDGVHFNGAGVNSISILRGRAFYSALNPVSIIGPRRRLQ